QGRRRHRRARSACGRTSSGGDDGRTLLGEARQMGEWVVVGREAERAHPRRVGDEAGDFGVPRRDAYKDARRARRLDDAPAELEDARADATADVRRAADAVLARVYQRIDDRIDP